MNVTVVWATPKVQDVVPVELPRGATVADAVARSGLLALHGLDPSRVAFAIFGHRAHPAALLADGDRVELTRPLLFDPQVARAHRASAMSLGKPARRVKRGRAA